MSAYVPEVHIRKVPRAKTVPHEVSANGVVWARCLSRSLAREVAELVAEHLIQGRAAISDLIDDGEVTL